MNVKTRRAACVKEEGRRLGFSANDESVVGRTCAALQGVASERGDEKPASDCIDGLAEALSGEGAQTSRLRLPAMALGGRSAAMRGRNAIALALGRRSAAVRRGGSAAS
eukprot:3316923-Pleurochrysis_carterae.AAC.1